MRESEIDHLALGLTRAPTFMGINLKNFFGNLMLCALICINANTIWGIPLFFILHIWMAKISLNEPNFFEIYSKALMLTPPLLNRFFWGKTNSYEPW